MTNRSILRMMTMGIAVLQGWRSPAAGSENNSLHLLMSADHRFIILLVSGYRDVYHRIRNFKRDPKSCLDGIRHRERDPWIEP